MLKIPIIWIHHLYLSITTDFKCTIIISGIWCDLFWDYEQSTNVIVNGVIFYMKLISFYLRFTHKHMWSLPWSKCLDFAETVTRKQYTSVNCWLNIHFILCRKPILTIRDQNLLIGLSYHYEQYSSVSHAPA